MGKGSSGKAAKVGGQKDHYEQTFGHRPMDREHRLEPVDSVLWKDAVGFTAGLLGVSEQEAFDYNAAVNDYTSISYEKIRRYQRGEQIEPWALEATAKRAELIEGYIERAPKWNGGKTYRGIGAESLPGIGDIIDMGGTSSWSSRLDSALDYADYASKKIVFVSPSQSKGTSTKHLSYYPNENEVTVSKNAKYKVQSVKNEGGISYVYVKEV